MSRASERGLFYEHKHHSKWFKKAPVQLPVKNHFGASQIKKRPLSQRDLSCWTHRGQGRLLSEAHGRLSVLSEGAEHQNKDDVKAPRQALSVSSKLLWPSSLLADGTRWRTEDAEETSTPDGPSVTPSNRTGNQGVAIETVNYEWTGRGRAGAVDLTDGLRCWCFTAPCKSQSWNQRRDIFLDRILETSDATYRHQSRMTAVLHTHTYSTHAHTQKYKHMQTYTYLRC